MLEGIETVEEYFVDLRKRLTNAGISANRLAAQAEMAPTQISRWMNQGVEPMLANVLRLEKAFRALLKRRK